MNRHERRVAVRKDADGWTPFTRATAIPSTEAQLRHAAAALGHSYEEMAQAEAERITIDEIWRNNIYQVVIDRGLPYMIHLSIKRIDRAVIHDWRALQRIKNELVGPENEAVELFPAESRVVDLANQFHLWVFTDPAYRVPFGFHQGRHVSNAPLAGRAKQRPRDEDAT